MPEFDFDPDGHVDLDAADHLDEIELGVVDRRRVDNFFRSGFDTDLEPGWRNRVSGNVEVTTEGSSEIDELVVLDPTPAAVRRRPVLLVSAAVVALVAGALVTITSLRGDATTTTSITTAPGPTRSVDAPTPLADPPTQSTVPELTLRRGAKATFGYWYDLTITGPPDSEFTVHCNDSVDEQFWTQTFDLGPDGRARDATLCYSGDGPDHWVTTDEGIVSNVLSW